MTGAQLILTIPHARQQQAEEPNQDPPAEREAQVDLVKQAMAHQTELVVKR